MLMLTRKVNETIVVKKDGVTIVEFTLRKIQSKRVSLAIDADKSYIVLRKELDEHVSESE